jgi:hypothetical protein
LGVIPALAATVALTACELTPTGPTAAQLSDDYALVVFGDAGAALEGMMGPQDGTRPFDGRTGRAQLPDSLALSTEQLEAIAALRETFRLDHADELAALKAIFDEARAARRGGATREQIRAILGDGRAIHEALRPDVQALHEAIRAVFTDAQRAWIAANRPMGPRPMGPRPMGPR